MNQKRILVCTRCFTYNQAPYIEDALNGFTMQETTFPYVCVIVDDASTDGEPEIIKSYLSSHFEQISNDNIEETEDYVKYVAQHKTNRNCVFLVLLLKYNHYGKKDKSAYFQEWMDSSKYVAICEGDDYWIDPQKLQNQVDILNRYSNVKLVYSAFQTVNEEKEEIEIEKYNNYIAFSRSGDVFSRLLWRNFILTLTVCFRKEAVYDSYLFKHSPRQLDYLNFLSAAALGDVYFIPQKMGCYRITSTGSVATRSNMIFESIDKLSDYFSIQYVKGNTKEIKGRYGKLVMGIVILTRAFRDKKVLLQILNIKKKYVLLLPIAMVIKTIDFLGLRYIPHYSEFSMYNIIENRKDE